MHPLFRDPSFTSMDRERYSWYVIITYEESENIIHYPSSSISATSKLCPKPSLFLSCSHHNSSNVPLLTREFILFLPSSVFPHKIIINKHGSSSTCDFFTNTMLIMFILHEIDCTPILRCD